MPLTPTYREDSPALFSPIHHPRHYRGAEKEEKEQEEEAAGVNVASVPYGPQGYAL